MTFSAPDLADKFDLIRDALEWAVNDSIRIFWKHQALEGRNREPNQVWGELMPFSITRLGTDEIRYENIGSNPVTALQAVQCGNRLLTFQLNMRSRSQEHRTSAWMAATRGQMRISSPHVRTTWFTQANELGLATVGDVIPMPDGYVNDDRIEDVSVMEFAINTVLNETDAANIVYLIDQIKASTGFKNVDGNDWPSGLQLTNEVMPP
jgi:hypothetical protein